MDIADYIIELLQQHETAVVPGLGSFHTSRVEGYYNKEEQKFYPPSLLAQFTKEEQDGTDLPELIAERRQISLASARYFIEKFVTSVKEQAGTQSVPLGKMGVFVTKRGELVFEPNSLNESYELYYGLSPEKLKRSSAFKQQALEEVAAEPPRSPFFEKARPVAVPSPVESEPEPIPVPVPPVVITEAELTVPQAEETHIGTPPVHTVFTPPKDDIVDEPEDDNEVEYTKRGLNIWLLLAIIIVILGVGIIGLYKYKPELFSRFIAAPSKPAPAKPVSEKTNTDSLHEAMQAQHDSASTKVDSIAPKPITPETLPITAALDTFGVVVAAEPSLKLAEIEVQHYIRKGYPQTGYKHKPNSKKMFFINVETYFNVDSAQATRLKLLKELNLASDQISVQKYPYKKP
jgi:nucleoid DNA-binding protein